MKKYSVTIFLLLVILLSSFIISGKAGATEILQPDEIKTLTVSFVNEAAIEEKIAFFESTRRNVKVIATNHGNDFQRFYEQLQKNLMVNETDDLFEVTGLPYYEYAEKGLLANIYDYIENDEKFNKEEHYMNILKSMEYRGGLYAYPKSFDMEFIAVNKNAPAALLAEFNDLSSIDYRGLVDLYNTYCLDGELYLEPEFTLKSKVYQSIAELVNFENKACDFNNPEFIRMLTDYRLAVKPGNEDTVPITSGLEYKDSDIDLGMNYIFRKVRFSEFLYFIGYDSVLYTHAIPLTNSGGEIIIDPYNAYAIYEGCENKELAWDFAKFLSSRLIVTNYSTRYLPLNRIALERRYWSICDMAIDYALRDISGQYKLEDSIFKYVDSAFEFLQQSCEIPAHVRYPYFDGADLVLNEVDLFLNDLISAEQAAANIQSKMMILLAE